MLIVADLVYLNNILFDKSQDMLWKYIVVEDLTLSCEAYCGHFLILVDLATYMNGINSRNT